ncbi:OsmC family protein [Elusimicrobiota bacterium]
MDLISVEQENGTKVNVSIRKHGFSSDMSSQDGGEDRAPSPAELLVGSLGACIAMVINRYCVAHKYDSEGINVSLTFELDKDPKRIKAITADVELPKNFPQDRRDAVKRVIETCPIHNTLHNPPQIDVEVV